MIMRSNFGERGTVYSHAIVWGLEVLQPAKFLDQLRWRRLIVKKPSTVPRSRFDGDDERSAQVQVEDASTDGAIIRARTVPVVGASLRLVATSNPLVLSIVPHLVSSHLNASCLRLSSPSHDNRPNATSNSNHPSYGRTSESEHVGRRQWTALLKRCHSSPSSRFSWSLGGRRTSRRKRERRSCLAGAASVSALTDIFCFIDSN